MAINPITPKDRIIRGGFIGNQRMFADLQALTGRVPYKESIYLTEWTKIDRNTGAIAMAMETSTFNRNSGPGPNSLSFLAFDCSDADSAIRDIRSFTQQYSHYLIEGLPIVGVTSITAPNPLVEYHRIERRFGDFGVSIGGHVFHPISKMFDINAALADEEEGSYLAFSRFMLAVEKNREARDSFVDFRTGLPGERAFGLLLSEALFLSERESSSMAVMYADLRKFKEINDDYSHDAGDQVLELVADIFKNALRSSDIVSRPHGDEFLFCLPNITPEGLREVIRRILDSLHSSEHAFMRIHPGLKFVDASIGAVFVNYGDQYEREILGTSADLYYKGTGKRLPELLIHVADQLSYIFRYEPLSLPIGRPSGIAEIDARYRALRERYGSERS